MMEVVYRNALPANAQLVAGSYAHGAPPRGALAGAVTTQMAARFGLHPGSRVVLTIPTGPVQIVITAIVRIRGPNSSFWAKDSTVGLPSRITGRETCNCWGGSIFADPDQFVAMQNALGSSSIDIQWVYPLAVGGVGADGAQALLNNLNRASTVPLGLTGEFAPAVSTTTVTTLLVPVVSAFLVTQAAVQTVLLLLFVSLIVVGAAVILLAAGMIAVRRADDLGLLRSRGASVRQVATLMLRGTAIVSVAGRAGRRGPGRGGGRPVGRLVGAGPVAGRYYGRDRAGRPAADRGLAASPTEVRVGWFGPCLPGARGTAQIPQRRTAPPGRGGDRGRGLGGWPGGPA